MNEELKKFLSELDHYNAAKIWEWLDDDPEAPYYMIKVIADTHPLLVRELCPPAIEKEEIPFNPDNPFKGDD